MLQIDQIKGFISQNFIQDFRCYSEKNVIFQANGEHLIIVTDIGLFPHEVVEYYLMDYFDEETKRNRFIKWMVQNHFDVLND